MKKDSSNNQRPLYLNSVNGKRENTGSVIDKFIRKDWANRMNWLLLEIERSS